ncbi:MULTISPECIES: hypothetical protein [Nonomuraea]
MAAYNWSERAWNSESATRSYGGASSSLTLRSEVTVIGGVPVPGILVCMMWVKEVVAFS